MIPLALQGAMGAFDNLWNHELVARLPARPGARRELALHAARGLVYGPVFVVFGWLAPSGWWAFALAAILVGEIGLTLADFVEEDRTRRLGANERSLHTLMTINYGIILALVAPALWQGFARPTGVELVDRGAWAWLLTAYGIGAALWGLRDALASRALRRTVPAWRARPLAVGRRPAPRTIAVLGGTGFVGAALVRRLVGDGERVIVVARDEAKAADLFGSKVEIVDAPEAIDPARRVDAVVNLAGAPLADRRWTPARKVELVPS